MSGFNVMVHTYDGNKRQRLVDKINSWPDHRMNIQEIDDGEKVEIKEEKLGRHILDWILSESEPSQFREFQATLEGLIEEGKASIPRRDCPMRWYIIPKSLLETILNFLGLNCRLSFRHVNTYFYYAAKIQAQVINTTDVQSLIGQAKLKNERMLQAEQGDEKKKIKKYEHRYSRFNAIVNLIARIPLEKLIIEQDEVDVFGARKRILFNLKRIEITGESIYKATPVDVVNLTQLPNFCPSGLQSLNLTRFEVSTTLGFLKDFKNLTEIILRLDVLDLNDHFDLSKHTNLKKIYISARKVFASAQNQMSYPPELEFLHLRIGDYRVGRQKRTVRIGGYQPNQTPNQMLLGLQLCEKLKNLVLRMNSLKELDRSFLFPSCIEQLALVLDDVGESFFTEQALPNLRRIFMNQVPTTTLPSLRTFLLECKLLKVQEMDEDDEGFLLNENIIIGTTSLASFPQDMFLENWSFPGRQKNPMFESTVED